jgi:signal transduction histidine kinase
MSRLRLPRSIRGRLFVTVVGAVALALVAMIAGFNLLLQHNLSRNADQLLRARAGAELALVRVQNGKVTVGETADDAAVDSKSWVFSGGRTLEAPQTGASLASTASALAARAPATEELAQNDTRLYAAPITSHGRRLGAVVASISLAPYEETERTALVASLALGGLLLLVVALAARWSLAASLRPVVRMTRQAADWSERDLDRRFGLGEPYDEVTELASTLDQLLERRASGLRREQRFSTELSHELRTPLARVITRAEVALRQHRDDDYRAALEDVLRNAQEVSRTIDALVAAARYDSALARGTADAYAVSEQTLEAVGGIAAGRHLELAVDKPAQSLRLGIDADLAKRILQPVVENACRYGRHQVRVRLARDVSHVVYLVEDDGPGVSPRERDSIFEPGVRGDAGRASNGAGGAGLGLALARRLARGVSGDVDVRPGRDGGRFVVSLPAV